MRQHLPFTGEHVAVVAITRHGVAQAGRVVAALPGARLFVPTPFEAAARAVAPGAVTAYAGKTGEQIPTLFAAYAGLVCIVSLGAVVRLLAPHLRGKDDDPGVVVLDEGGRFAIPVLSGHLGGANALAALLAERLGATPVITTASDSRGTLAVDLLGREFGWVIEAPKANVTRACAAVVNDAPVALVQEAGERQWWTRKEPLPANLHLVDSLEAIDPDAYAAVLWISHRRVPIPPPLIDKLVVYRPVCEAAP